MRFWLPTGGVEVLETWLDREPDLRVRSLLWFTRPVRRDKQISIAERASDRLRARRYEWILPRGGAWLLREKVAVL